MNGFTKLIGQEPRTDEEALSYLTHPFTTEYQDLYKELRGKGISIKISLLAAMEMRIAHIQIFLTENEESEK